MKKIWILPLVMVYLACFAGTAAAQEPPEQGEQPAKKAQAEEEVRTLEQELVRKVKGLLVKRKPVEDPVQEQVKEDKTSKATLPEPVKHDAQTLQNQLIEWKSKSLAMVDLHAEQRLAELESKHIQQLKKLNEKKKKERIVLDPKRRPPGNEDGKFERAIEREIAKLNGEFEAERRKVDKEWKQERERIERLAKELERAIMPEEHRESRKRKSPKQKQRKQKDKP